MEQYFSKQLNSCCQLNFSNKLLKSQKFLIQSKEENPKPIHFTKKSQKKSLKRISSQRLLELRKKKSIQTSQNQKKIINSNQEEDYVDDYGNHRKFNKKALNSIDRHKNINCLDKYTQKALHRSLDKFPTRQIIPKRNIIEDLRNYKGEINRAVPLKPSKIQMIIDNSGNMKGSTNLNGNMRQAFTPAKAYQTAQPRQSNQQFYQYNQFSPEPQLARSASINERYQSNRIISYTNPSKFKDFANITPIKTNQRPNTFVITKTSNPNYEESFKKIYGQVDLQEEIKRDLMTSIELHKVEPTMQSRYHGAGYFNSPSSDASTMIPSESKFRKRFEGQYFDNSNYEKKVKTQHYFNLNKSNLFAEGDEFKQACQKREKFKSIVSVNSEDGSSSQSLDSIILDKHPQQVVSSRPIRTIL